jgi:gliding motility-associated-like protein
MNKFLILITIVLLSLNSLAQIYVPNSFTPNNDGVNDYVKVFSEDTLDVYEFKIFNSWGELIWESYDLNDKWNGGDDYYAPSNNYSYTLRYRVKGYSFIRTKKGFITIVR